MKAVILAILMISGALVAGVVIELYRLPAWAPFAIVVRCLSLTPSALWADRVVSRKRYLLITIALWVSSAIVGATFLAVLPEYAFAEEDCLLLVLERELLLATLFVGCPAAGLFLGVYFRKDAL